MAIRKLLKGRSSTSNRNIQNCFRITEIPISEIKAERDDCGAPTLYLKLVEMSKLYSILSSSENAELEQISRSMTTNPKMLSDNNKFDTEIINSSHGQVIVRWRGRNTVPM